VLYGANLPAVIRGLITVAWYGIQTNLASSAFTLIILKFFPSMGADAEIAQYHCLGLSYLGGLGFMLLWVLQAIVFWSGMNSIRKCIAWAGPVWLVDKAGWSHVHLNLAG
jgi:NCS1 family nucleobase:cation symporter-1